MNKFSFQNPTKLIFGEGQIAQLATEVAPGSKVLMTYGGGSIKSNGVYKQVVEALGACQIIEFAGIEPNPDYSTLVKAIEIGKKENIDLILAVGGGSVIDGSKFIACGIAYEGDAWEIVTNPKIQPQAVPLATVLTLPATGSEMNNGAVISRREFKQKFPFFNPFAFPKFSILDPEVILSLPARQVANGIVDTFAHTLEQYLIDSNNSPLMDRWAEGILQTLVEISPAMKQENPEIDACANFMLSATMALNGFIALGVNQDWATHMIGHELTALHGLDHGVTLAIVYPGIMQVMRNEKHHKLVQYGRRVWGIDACKEEEVIDLAIAKTEEFFKSLGMQIKLSDHHIMKDTIDEIVARFEQRGQNLGEGGIVTPEKVREALMLVL